MKARARPYENNTPGNVATRNTHKQRRAAGLCVNNAAHGKAYKGGRCLECWIKKIDAERLRQPDGTLKTRAKWGGPLPVVGDYLQSPQRPRYAYRITHVHVLLAADPAGDLGRRLLGIDDRTQAVFTLDRIALDEVPAGATIHEWRWDARGRKRGPRKR